MIEITLILLLFVTLFHVWFRVQDMGRRRKIVYSLASFSLFFIIFVLSSVDTDALGDLAQEQEKNEELSQNITALESSNEKLESELEELGKLEISISDLEDELIAVTKEKDSLQKKYDSLEKENEKLTKEITVMEEEVDELKSAASEAEKKAEAEKSTASSESSSSSTSETQTEECDIKGSVNGIYHTPGSRYYNQTKNVAQWFCSTAEAENAGYRAPKQ